MNKEITVSRWPLKVTDKEGKICWLGNMDEVKEWSEQKPEVQTDSKEKSIRQ